MGNGKGQDAHWLRRPMFNGAAEPWWVRLLERLGLPTFLLLVVLYGGYKLAMAADAKWTVHSQKLVESLDGFTAEQRTTNAKLEDLNDNLEDLTEEHRRPYR